VKRVVVIESEDEELCLRAVDAAEEAISKIDPIEISIYHFAEEL